MTDATVTTARPTTIPLWLVRGLTVLRFVLHRWALTAPVVTALVAMAIALPCWYATHSVLAPAVLVLSPLPVGLACFCLDVSIERRSR